VAFAEGYDLLLLHLVIVGPEPLVGYAVVGHDLLDGAQDRGSVVRRDRFQVVSVS